MQRKPTIFLVTYAGEPTLTDDDQLLRRAIEQQGGIGIPKCWNDPSVVWREADLAVIRSTWDYIFDLAAFRDWIGRVCIETELVNDPRLLLWNVDKHYLLDLQAQGVAIVPTLLVNEDADSGSALESARVQYRESIVIKPTVSCGSHLTRRFTPTNEQGHADAINHLKLVLRHSAALIQPLLEEVFSQGERSLIFLEGRYSHTAPKEPFREGLSPTYPNRALVSTASEIVFCERVLSGLAVMPQYARVDIIIHEGQPFLNELELIEPELHFHLKASSAPQMACSLIKLCHEQPRYRRPMKANPSLIGQALSRE